MRLTCPRCGAQYEIDGAAIPPGGRDVECSACDHVWRALPDAFDPKARPPLSRPLSDSVIEILREEAARELEVRDAERRLQRAAERAAAALAEPASEDRIGKKDGDGDALASAPEVEAMAREGTGAGKGGGTAQALSAALPDEASADSPDSAVSPQTGPGPRNARSLSPDHDGPGVAAADPEGSGGAIADPVPKVAAMPPVQTAAPAPSAPPASALHQPRHRAARSRRYDTGFRVAVIVALAAVALYALAPRLGGAGPLGATLAAWRSEVDQGRDWLSLQGNAAVGRLRAAAGGR